MFCSYAFFAHELARQHVLMDLSGTVVCHLPRPGGFRTENLLLHPGIDFLHLHLAVLETSIEMCLFAFCTSTWELKLAQDSHLLEARKNGLELKLTVRVNLKSKK